MTLLELTQQEVEVVKRALIAERHSYMEESMTSIGKAELEKGIRLCDSIWDKVDRASQPQEDLLITASDLFFLISSAKDQYRHLRADLHISNKRVEESDFKHISLANAVILWLNSKNLLKRLASFDFTDLSSQYEESEE
jgi:uncharacterized protein YydD (DUF2326 family)